MFKEHCRTVCIPAIDETMTDIRFDNRDSVTKEVVAAGFVAKVPRHAPDACD